MFYVKAQPTDDIEIKITLYDDEIFTTCSECNREVQVNEELLISVLQDGDLASSQIICESCTAIRDSESLDPLVEGLNPYNDLETWDDLMHAIMDVCIEIEKGNLTHEDATFLRISKIIETYFNKKGIDV